MAGIWMAAGSAISALAGGIGAAQQAAAQKELMKKILALYKKQAGQETIQYEKQLALLQGALKDQGKTFDAAKKDLSFYGQQAKQGILDQSKQAQAGAQQQLVSSGLYNTTVGANMQSGIQGQAGKALAGVDQQLGQMFSGLTMAKGQATTAAKGALAAFYDKPHPWTTLQGKMAELWGANPPQNPYAGIGSALGGIFGAFGQQQNFDAYMSLFKKQGDGTYMSP